MPPRTTVAARLSRYPVFTEYSTNLAPHAGLLGQLTFLTSLDYAADLLMNRHSVASKDAKARAKRVVAYARTALSYIEQTEAGPPVVAFLPAYYSALDLIKICILFGKHHALLDQNRFHGAQYDVIKKDSRSLLSEEITLHPKGAISLYYETITGHRIKKARVLRLSDIYPYIPDVAAELDLATGRVSAELAGLVIEAEVQADKSHRLFVRALVPKGHRPLRRKQLRVLRGFTVVKGEPNVFAGSTLHPASSTPNQAVAQCLDHVWLYSTGMAVPVTPIYSGTLVLFQELPILLALFHLSSVVRYKPEFLSRLRDSRFWPVIATIATDAHAKLLNLIWSHLQQVETTFVPARGPGMT